MSHQLRVTALWCGTLATNIDLTSGLMGNWENLNISRCALAKVRHLNLETPGWNRVERVAGLNFSSVTWNSRVDRPMETKSHCHPVQRDAFWWLYRCSMAPSLSVMAPETKALGFLVWHPKAIDPGASQRPLWWKMCHAAPVQTQKGQIHTFKKKEKNFFQKKS